MAEQDRSVLTGLIQGRSGEVLARWVAAQELQVGNGGPAGRWVREGGGAILEELGAALTGEHPIELSLPVFDGLRRTVEQMSAQRAVDGASPSEVATGVLLLREALVAELEDSSGGDVPAAAVILQAGRLVDALALLTFESYVLGREQIIRRQHGQLSELSTPVVRLWDGIVSAPLVGTLDSNRASAVMEALLEAIVRERASVAILDITGVPTVDTLVAQHLFKTVTATRLMGADCIISGISPQTALTIVQLGIDLTEVTTRATLADALVTAIGWVTQDAGSLAGN